MRTPSSGNRPGSSGLAAPRRGRAWAVLGLAGAMVLPTFASAGDFIEVGRWAARAIILARGGTLVSFPGAVLQAGSSDCGPAALATLIRTLGGVPPATDSIARLAGTGARGTSFAGLSRAATSLGWSNELRRMDSAALADLSTPVIAWVEGGHFVTVVPESAGVALVLDPQAGPYRIGRKRLGRFWKGAALVPTPDSPVPEMRSPRMGGTP